MLSNDQCRVLQALILPLLGTNPNVEIVSLLVGDDIALDMPTVNRPYTLAQWIVNKALSQNTPDVLIKLVGAVDNLDAGAASIVQLAEHLEADPSGWRGGRRGRAVDWNLTGDPLEVDDDGGPFLDRERFRRLLPRIGVEDGPTCILVQGAQGSGKTYLSKFCTRLSREREELRVGYASLGASGSRSVGPDTPALDLAKGLQTSLAREPRWHEDPHRYARNLAAWIASHTPKKPIPALAILDEVEGPNLPDAIHTFVQDLVRRIQTDPNASARLRVVLLGYDAARLEEAGLEFETCILEFIDAPHIDAWFRSRYPARESYEYEDTVAMILDRVREHGSSRLHKLCARIQLVGRNFFQTP